MPRQHQPAQFALYHFRTCPFCMVTRAALKGIELEVEQRDIHKHPSFRSELAAGGGKTQVPCLRIEEQGQVSWLYESQDIIRYLKQRATELPRSA